MKNMMTQLIDKDLRMQCVVRLSENNKEKTPIGSGVLYYEKDLGDRIYLLTAAHCLYTDSDSFMKIRDDIIVNVFSPKANSYKEILVDDIKKNSVRQTKKTNDLAVLILNKADVDSINNDLPSIGIVCRHADINEVVALGFPQANKHKKVMPVIAVWMDGMIDTNQFYLRTDIDIIEDYVHGYSGGGLFLQTNNDILLLGLFVRFQMEERGRLIYGQLLDELNELLTTENFPHIHYCYIGVGGLLKSLVKSHIQSTIENLGPNFNPDLRIRTNVHDGIDAVARNQRYRKKLFKVFSEWLNELRIYGNEKDSVVGQLESKYMNLQLQADSLCDLDTNVSKPFDFSRFTHELLMISNDAEKQISTCYTEVESLSSNEKKQTDEQLLSRLYCIRNHCERFKYIIDRCFVNLSNMPIVIIKGEAGCGKSHLLGDTASSRLDQGLPSLFILGRDVNKDLSIETNILNIVGLKCSFDDLAQSMNRIGSEMNCRFLILIDAINETEGNHYWRNKLAGFFEKIRRYPAVGLILTVRSTYLQDEIPAKYLQEGSNVTILNHDGFAGCELEAIPKFCKYYGIATPTLPILTPEYANPLLLSISCQVAKRLPEKKFIPAHNGIGSLFNEYRKLMDENFDEKRDNLYNGLNVVHKSIKAIVSYMWEQNVDRIEFSKCRQLILDDVDSLFINLLNDLIADCLLTKVNGYGENSETCYVRFTFQRLCDYFLADYILTDCKDTNTLLEKFSNSDFKKNFRNNYNFYGIFEQLAALFPERYDLEFWNVIQLDFNNLFVDQSRVLMDSLKWRNPKHIDKDVVIKYLENSNADIYYWLNICVLLAPIPHHPFNSDYISSKLGNMKLAERDRLLQPFLLDYYYYTDSSYPDQFIKGLLNWAWLKDVSINIDSEVARLAGQMLAWMLCSTINCLRDRVTKAMVNLLQNHSGALLAILKSFESVDDVYIQERLYAVAYGCVLRTKGKNNICMIGRYVYERIFKDGQPPRHILLRDYACNTVDYAVKKGELSNIDMKLVLPPYNEVMPDMPSLKDIEKFMIPDSSFKNEPYAIAQNYIISSLIDGFADFGTKIVDYRIDNFCSWSFIIENEYRNFKKNLRGTKRKIIGQYEQVSIIASREMKIKKEHPHREPDLIDFQAKMYQIYFDFIQKLETCIIQLFGSDSYDKLKNVYVPNHELMNTHYEQRKRNSWPIRYWIVQRVFDLGYDRKIHGKYDEKVKRLEGYNYRSNNNEGRAERIGKKYQRIALHEILGCMADNYEIECSWDTRKLMIYDGAWQNYLRDIDPTCITRVSENSEDAKPTWHDYNDYSFWHLDGNTWLDTTADVNDIKNFLQRTDEKGKLWLTVNDNKTCCEPKILGGETWSSNRYNIINVHAYIIHGKDKIRLINKSNGVNFDQASYPWSKDVSTYHITREKYWSRAYMEETKYYPDKWQELYEECGISVRLLCENLNGNIEDDHSGTRANYFMPTKVMMQLLELDYDNLDGSYVDKDGHLIATSNPNRTSHFLMAKKELVTALRSKGWDIVWIVSMNKFYTHAHTSSTKYSRMTLPSGLFYLDDAQNIQGSIQIFDR